MQTADVRMSGLGPRLEALWTAAVAPYALEVLRIRLTS